MSNETNVSDGWSGGWGEGDEEEGDEEEGDEEDEDGEVRMTSASELKGV